MNEIHVCWEWPLESQPEDMWPLISDTDRFNADSGVPSIEQLGQEEFQRRLRLSKFGVTVEWEEEPFEWLRPERFGVVRRYKQGPLREMRVLAEVLSNPTRLRYQVWATPRNWIMGVAVRAQLMESGYRFGKTVKAYDAISARKTRPIEVRGVVRLVSGGADRMERARRELLAQGMSEDVVSRLCLLVQHGDDFDVHRMRPYAYAREWNTDRRTTLELFLRATRAGLLVFQWALLCPLCRGAKQKASGLSEVDPRVHCEGCNIDFEVDFERSVELTFQPGPAVRAVNVQEYCVGGPQNTPHIVMQQILGPAEDRRVKVALEPGLYRFRQWGVGGSRMLRADAQGVHRDVALDGVSGGELSVSLEPALHLVNTGNAQRVMILERFAWSDEAATAADVTAMQVFRDLFPEEALRPSVPLSMESLTVMFTDVVDSTGLYRRLGDAVAVSRLLQQQKLIREKVEGEGGAVVKSIGDRTMSVFRSPLAALRAAHNIQRSLASSIDPMRLKVGIHAGPSVAVTLDERMDYFGETVNVASRLCGLCGGEEVVASEAVLRDAEAASWLAMEGIVQEASETRLAGGESLTIHSLRVVSHV